MSDDRTTQVARVALFCLAMLLIVELSPLVTKALSWSAQLQELAATLFFFLTFGLMYFVLKVFLRWEGRYSITELGLTLDSNTVPLTAVGAFAGLLAAGFVVLLAANLGGQLRPPSEITADLVLSEAIITAPVAVFEELSYRGYMMSRMTRLWGLPGGLIVSSIVFSIVHFGWWSPLGLVPYHLVALFSLNLFVGGVVLGLGYHFSGHRLWAPVGFHFSWNMMAYILFPLYPSEPVRAPELFQIEWGITTMPGFALGLIVMLLLMMVVMKKEKGGESAPGRLGRTTARPQAGD